MRHDEYVREIQKFHTLAGKQLKFRKALAAEYVKSLHYALGIAEEAGELIGVIKRVAVYGRELDEDRKGKLVEELGDLYNYLSMLTYEMDITLEEVRATNVRKLEARVQESPNYFVPGQSQHKETEV